MGKSGALISTSGPNKVFKEGDSRVIEQGRWLQENTASFLPRVIQVQPVYGGYEMERYEHLPRPVDYYRLTEEMIEQLTNLWNRQFPEQQFDWLTHERYLEERVHPQLLMPLLKWGMLLLMHYRGKECVTHGDPTWDNCMITPGWPSRLILIDPLPPTPALPSIRALDVAKICQSVLGYESVIYGDPQAPLTLDDVRARVRNMSNYEWQVVLYLTAIHFVRLRRYTPEHEDTWWRRTVELLGMRDDSWTQ